ncbi:MAG: hypothetical protein A2W31_07725 [Planctomycetes bacterium RBG_16_64_10]|nr:MAG: hypothetical protein A2W31_07725 [Planctomycetes bacterium RBG_16_64_10]
MESGNSAVKLRRVLKLSDLVIYGIILIQPVAALPLFGHANQISNGHAAATIALSMLAMLFTAISYGRMANRFPAAGSAYTYVGKGLHEHLGFIAGWSMFMDYLLVPILCVIFTSIAAKHLVPAVPYVVWVAAFAVLFTAINLRGIKVTARANWVLMLFMSVVVFYFMGAAVRFVFLQSGVGGLWTVRPFYDPRSFSWDAVWSGTALAALTYIGFDGLTTLSEEVENPRRNVLLAAVLTCLITGLWSGSQVYLAQVAWPDWESFTAGLTDQAARNNALDTAIMAVANRVGGAFLDGLLSFTLILGSVGSGVTAQVGAARLLYGMGRDRVLPAQFFAYLSPRTASPTRNLWLIGLLALAGATFLNYEECARLINFGAFLAFMGVNLASIREYFFRNPSRNWSSALKDFVPAAAGFLFCLVIWGSLPLKTFVLGGSWMLIGVVYLAFRTGGFRRKIEMTVFNE